jgi:molybdopterin-binding protein
MRIDAQNLTKSFDGKQVLSDVSLSVDQPGIYSLVGPNGSGKTTLMRLLALLEKPDTGILNFEGETKAEDLNGLKARGLRNRMVLIHNPAVMLSGQVKYNVGYGLRVRGIPALERKQKVRQILEKLSLGNFEKREAKTLSAGEIQRVALARAMAIDPEVVFLDEPTANLDPISTKLIEHSILELAGRGKMVIVATHNLWQVERIANWVWFLNNGVVTLSGTAGDVLHKGDQTFWGKFLGRDNMFNGEIVAKGNIKCFKIGNIAFEVVTDIIGPAMASLNPNEVILSTQAMYSSARNVINGVIKEADSEGGLYKIIVDIGLPLTVAITKASWDELGLTVGSNVYAIFKASSVRVWREE